MIQDRLEHQPIVTEPVPRTEAIVFLLSVVLIVTTAFVSPSVYNISLVFFAYSVGIGASAVLLSAGSSGVLRMFWPAIPFVLLQAFSGFWSANPNSTVSYALMFAGMLMFGMMSHHSTNGGYHKGLLRVVGVVVLLVSLYGIYQYFYGFERSSEYLRKFGESELGLAGTGVERTLAALAYKRAFSTFMSSNVLASFLACALPLIGYLFLSSKNAGSRIFHGICIAAGLIALGLTRSVGGFLAFGMAVAVFGAVSTVSAGPALRKKLLAGMGIAAVVLGICGYMVIKSRTGGFRGIETSIGERLSYWSGAVGIGLEKPVAGYGAGTFHTMYLGRIQEGGSESRYAHNVFLQTFAETGIMGLAALVLLFASYFSRATRGVGSGGDGFLYAALCASGAAFVAHNLVDFTFYLPSGSLLFWMCYGIMGSLTSAGARPVSESQGQRYAAGGVGVAVVAVFIVFFGLSHIARQKVDHAVNLLSEAGIKSNADARSTAPPKEALELAEEAVVLKPYDDGMHAFLAGLYEGQAYASGPEYALRAEEEYLEAIDLNPYYPYHYRDLGILYLKLGRKELASEYISKALSLHPNDRNLREIKDNIES